MITALQIGLLLVLIALIGIILGYLFGKLSCKKRTDDIYFNKNDYCENEYVASNAISSDLISVDSENKMPESIIEEDNKNLVTNKEENSKINLNIDVSSNEEAQPVLSETKEKLKSDNNKKTDTEYSQNDDEDKPKVLSNPRDGQADNLCRIKGIGFVIEEKLHNLGVFHFDQIAAWSEKEIEWIDSHLAFSGRIKREDWIGQAKKLASGDETEFSKRVDKGKVSTSRKSSNK